MFRLKTVSRLIVAAALLGAQIFACSRAPSTTRDSVGSVELALSQPSALGVDVVTYVISGNGIPAIGGAIDVTTSTSATALVGGIPANPNPYLVTMDAISRDGLTTCHGEGSFTIEARQTAIAGVILQCRGPIGDRGGTVAIHGRLDNCPVVTSFSARTLEAPVGGSIVIGAQAFDPDAGDAVSFIWTASPAGIGFFPSPAAADTSFTCTAVGTTRLSIAVSDGFCGDSQTDAIPVTCLPPGSGGSGLGGSGFGGGLGGSGVGGSGGIFVECNEPTHGNFASCENCTTDNCSLSPNPEGTDGCCGISDLGDRSLCLAAASCFLSHASECVVSGDALPCFCGSSGGNCFAFAGAANGKCVAQVLAAAKTPNLGVIVSLFTDPRSPLGRAVNLVGCQGVFCSDECAFTQMLGTGGRGAGGAGGTGGVGTGGVGTGGNASGGNGAGGFGIGGSGGTCAEISSGDPVACPQCTTFNCALAPAPDGTDGCCGLPAPDDQNLCRVAVACFSAFGCTISGDASRCFCGNSGAACFAIPGAASGPCVNEVVAAAKTSDPPAIRPQFTSITSPLGRAVNLMGCRGAFCPVECAVP